MRLESDFQVVANLAINQKKDNDAEIADMISLSNFFCQV